MMLQAVPISMIDQYKDGDSIMIAGLPLVRQRPGTATGICFITIEDETGFANLVVFEKFFTKYRKEILRSHLLMVEGRVQREGEVTHVIVRRCRNVSVLLDEMVATEEKDQSASAASRQKKPLSDVVQGEIFPGGRNFR
jgi:error-prone DNA polymerase